MKKAFTLVELMIAVILFSIIVTFLYESVAQLQRSNEQLLTQTHKVDKREAILKLLYNDFINARSITVVEKLTSTDTIRVQSYNSLYEMSEPYIYYKVYKGENTLRRIESPVEELNYEQNLYRFDTLSTGVSFFKVYESKGHYLIYLKLEGAEDIYLDIYPPSLVLAKPDKNLENDINSSKNEE